MTHRDCDLGFTLRDRKRTCFRATITAFCSSHMIREPIFSQKCFVFLSRTEKRENSRKEKNKLSKNNDFVDTAKEKKGLKIFVCLKHRAKKTKETPSLIKGGRVV